MHTFCVVLCIEIAGYLHTAILVAILIVAGTIVIVDDAVASIILNNNLLDAIWWVNGRVAGHAIVSREFRFVAELIVAIII